MCGIAAFYNPTSLGVTKNDMKNFNKTLYRRGPDSDGYWINSNNTLGLSMQRLSILDLNNGYQPMFDTTENYAIVFNGEIFNCNKLRKDLEKEGCEFRTKNSDTEVILNGYKYYGNKISSLLNGMFAFVIYDKIKNQIFFSRDYFGIKPLYFSKLNNGIVVGSTLNTLLSNKEVKNNSSLNLKAVKDLFYFDSIQNSNQIYSNISEVKPGTYLTYDLKNDKFIDQNQYHNFNFSLMTNYQSDQIYDELNHKVNNAVNSWTQSDVGYSLSLSGGVDSNVIASILKGNDITAHTVSFINNDPELSISKSAVKKYSFDHKIYNVSPDAFKEHFNEMIFAMQEPYFGGLPSFFVYKNASKYSKVILTGSGGDELFGNYSKANYHMNIVKRFMYDFKFSLKNKLSNIQPSYYPLNSYYLNIFSELNNYSPLKTVSMLIDNNSHLNRYDLLNKLTINLQLSNEFLKITDRFSSHFSMEARTPFLDKDLSDYVFSMPFKLRKNNSSKKSWLINSFQKNLTSGVLKLKKTGFIEESIREDIYELDLLEKFTSKKFIDSQGIFIYKNIYKLLKNKNFKWRFYVFQYWFNFFYCR